MSEIEQRIEGDPELKARLLDGLDLRAQEGAPLPAEPHHTSCAGCIAGWPINAEGLHFDSKHPSVLICRCADAPPAIPGVAYQQSVEAARRWDRATGQRSAPDEPAADDAVCNYAASLASTVEAQAARIDRMDRELRAIAEYADANAHKGSVINAIANSLSQLLRGAAVSTDEGGTA